MSASIADGVLAATHKLVDQAMSGQWQDVPKTVEERRVLLDRLSASASPSDHSWLSALKQAMAESDAAVAKMANAEGTNDWGLGASQIASDEKSGDEIANVMDMIRGERL